MTDSAPFEKPPTSATLPGPRRADMFGRLIRLCLKELREILRDRRTIITLVLMPLLLYPFLSLIFNKLILTQFSGAEQIETRIGFKSEEDANRFRDLVASGEAVLRRMKQPTPEAAEFKWSSFAVEEPETRIKSGEIDLAVWRESETVDGIAEDRWVILHRPNSPIGREALSVLERRLQAVNQGLTIQLLRMRGLPPNLPADYQVKAVKEENAQAVSLASFIPLMLILMTITGAVYPAIDLTAGERERGTMEALISAPIPRIGLLLAKYVAVVFVALLTALANLLAMTITLYVTGLQTMVFGPEGISLGTISQIFGLLVLFAAFFAAVLLAITSFARSFKEAQAYLIPLMLLSLGPGIISLSPDIELSPTWAVTPLVNIVLLARDVLGGKFDPVLGLIVIQSTLLYAVAALAIAARVFGTDAILYGSQKGWRDFLRRPRESQGAPSISMAFFCLAMLFLLLFYALGALSQFRDQPMQVLACGYVVASVLIFVGIPLLFARQGNIRLVDGFRLHRSPIVCFAGAVLLGLSLWTISHELVLLSQTLGLVSLDAKQAQVTELVNRWRQLSPVLVVIAWGITPAIVEEFFFRGFLLRALSAKLRPIHAIWISAVVFGAFHVIGANILTPERFLPSTFIGIALGWLAIRSGSVFPGILLHAVHNSSMILVAYYEKQLADVGIGIEETTHLPLTWLAMAAVAMLIGGLLVWFGKSRRIELAQPTSLAAGVEST